MYDFKADDWRIGNIEARTFKWKHDALKNLDTFVQYETCGVMYFPTSRHIMRILINGFSLWAATHRITVCPWISPTNAKTTQSQLTP